MATYKRLVVGSIYKGQKDDDGNQKPDYMKIRCDEFTKQAFISAINAADPQKGIVLQLQSKVSQLQGIERAVSNGKMSAETGETIKVRIEKIPDYVRFEIVLLQKGN